MGDAGHTYHKAADDHLRETLPRFSPAARAYVEELQALDRISEDAQLPELGVALAVVKQAFADLSNPHPAIRADARDYLLRRLWEDEDNAVLQVLQHYGIRRFTKSRQIHAQINIVDGDTFLPMAVKRHRRLVADRRAEA